MVDIIQGGTVKLLRLRGGWKKCWAGLALALIGLLPLTAPAEAPSKA